MNQTCGRVAAAFTAVSTLFCQSAVAQDLSGPEALPPTIAAYARIADPPAVINALLDHPQRDAIEQLPPIAAAIEQPEFMQFQLGVKFVELQLGAPWLEAIEKLSRHGLHIAVDPPTDGIVLLARSEDAAFLARTRDVFLRMARDDASKNDRPDPVEEFRYRDIAAHKIGDAALAVVADWLVITNKTELGTQVVDRLLGDELPLLAEAETFRAAHDADDSSAVWAWVDLATLRDAGVAEKLFRGQAEDFNGELLVGGVMAALKESSHATLTVNIDRDGAQLHATLPRDQAVDAASRQYFFGEKNQGAAPPPVRVSNQIGEIRMHRDVAALWRLSPDIFDQQVNANLAKAESDLSNLFGGKSFSDDILGSLGPEFHLVFARQEQYESATPAIRLPAGAAIFRLLSPEESQRTLKIAFQTVIGFANIGAAQQGGSALDLSTEHVGNATIVATSYDSTDAGESGGAHIQYNFSPSIAFVDQWLVVSSTRNLAVELAKELAGNGGAAREAVHRSDGRVLNTAMSVSMPVLSAVLADNRENLIAQNMLEEGGDRDEAEQHVATIEAVVQLLQQLTLDLTIVGQAMQIQFNVGFSE